MGNSVQQSPDVYQSPYKLLVIPRRLVGLIRLYVVLQPSNFCFKCLNRLSCFQLCWISR